MTDQTSQALKSQPANQNVSQPTRFKIIFARLPNVTFWTQTAILPSLSAGYATSPTPFVDQKLPGDKLEYSSLPITMLVDEDLQSYREVHNWMRGYTFPTSFSEYANLGQQLRAAQRSVTKKPQYSDMFIHIYNNAWQHTMTWKFIDAFPTSMGELQYSASSGPGDTMLVDITFDYQYFDIEIVDSKIA